MSTDDIVLTLEPRKVTGKQVRALRREGRIPAVIHNHGKDSIVVMAQSIAINKVYESAGKHHPVKLKLKDEDYLAIIREVDKDPRKNTLRHVVFNAIRQNEKVQTEVPIKLEGDSQAEKVGLMLLTQLESVDVEAIPRNLPDEIVVNIESLAEIGDKITVADLKAPDGVTIITESEHPIVAVIETPAQVSEESEESETAEAGKEESSESSEKPGSESEEKPKE
jgi:large subunit ribosomal protein L25